MATVHVTQYFSTASPALIFDQCDALMTALIDREDQDPRIRDASVAADARLGLVEVTVVADGETQEAAAQAALIRVHDAVATVITDTPLLRRGNPITALDRASWTGS